MGEQSGRDNPWEGRVGPIKSSLIFLPIIPIVLRALHALEQFSIVVGKFVRLNR